jgi:hypothetical protein
MTMQVGELRSGSPRLEQLNRTISLLHSKGHLKILSFSESTVTPLVEGYGGYALRLEVVPIESAYPGFGELVVHLPLTHRWFLFASSYWVCVDVTTVKECGYAAGRQTDRGLFSEEVL